MNFDEIVYNLCKKIPKGKVSTYGLIAKKIKSKSYRAVGQALKRNQNSPKVPCHRVVYSNGKIGGFKGKNSGFAIKEKIRLLKKEGISIRKDKIINLMKFLHKF